MVTIDAARAEWSSAEVLTGVTRLAAEGRAVTADLIALLAVLDERRLFEAEGCGSLFEFCVTRLRLSESQAYHRIQAARAAARFPVILEHLREGVVTRPDGAGRSARAAEVRGDEGTASRRGTPPATAATTDGFGHGTA